VFNNVDFRTLQSNVKENLRIKAPWNACGAANGEQKMMWWVT